MFLEHNEEENLEEIGQAGSSNNDTVANGMEKDDDTMNSQDIFQAKFDKEIGHAESFNELGAISSTPKEDDPQILKDKNPQNQNIDIKLDKMIKMMDGLKEEVTIESKRESLFFQDFTTKQKGEYTLFLFSRVVVRNLRFHVRMRISIMKVEVIHF